MTVHNALQSEEWTRNEKVFNPDSNVIQC